MKSFTHRVRKFWPKTIRGQLVAGIAMVHLLLMTIFVLDLVRRQRRFLKKQNHEQVINFLNDYAANASRYMSGNDFEELERLTMSHASFSDLKYAMILSHDGVVLAHTNASYIGKKPVDNISRGLRDQQQTTTLIEDERVLDIAVPIRLDKETIGWARAAFGQQNIQTNLTAILQDGIFYIIIALMVGTVFALLIGNGLTAGLYKLIATANKIRKGDRHVRAPELKSVELSNLGTAINSMLDEVSGNERLLTMVIESMPVGVWILGPNGEIISGNSTGKKMWMAPDDFGMKDIETIRGWRTNTKEPIAPDQWPAVRALKKGETVLNEEFEILTFDGKKKIILASAIPMHGKAGGKIGAITISVDITETKQITEQLKLSESTLSNAFIYSSIGITLVSPEGNFMRVNKALCKMVGYSEEELLQLSFQDITHIDDLNEDLGYLNQTIAGEIDTYQMEKRYMTKDNAIIWVLLNVSLVRDAQNKPLFFVSQIQDITKRKEADALLKESEEKFRKLVEEIQVGVFILQGDEFVYINPQFEKITWYSKAEVLNRMSFEQLIQSDGLGAIWKEYMWAVAHEKTSGHFMLKAIRKDGALLQIEVILSAITFQDQPAVIGTIIDITEQMEEQKRINKAVTDAQESERQQIGMELHDNVKQMMAACLLNVDLLKLMVKEERTRPTIDSIKNYIRESIEELRRISHQLAPTIDSSVPLEQKIRTVVNTMNVGKEINVKYHFDSVDEVIKSDLQLALYRILQEQFTNILKHANASLVDITVLRSNGDICLSIEDNGIGFNRESTQNGIGLENIKRRVQAFNGNLSIQTYPGKGCRLYVQLPVN
jgi:PAS domain S-box-containing protein